MNFNNDFKHIIPLQIRLNDIDIMGHVNNSNIMEFFDLGRILYFQSLDFGINPEKKIPLVLVHYEVDFHLPIWHNDTLFVGTKTTKIGNKSVHLEQVIFTDKGEKKSSQTSILSAFDAQNNISIPVPDKIKKAMTSFDNIV